MAFSILKSPRHPDPRSPLFCSQHGPNFLTAPWKWEVLQRVPLDWVYTGPFSPGGAPFVLPTMLAVSQSSGDEVQSVAWDTGPVSVMFPDSVSRLVRVLVEYFPAGAETFWQVRGTVYIDALELTVFGPSPHWNILQGREYVEANPNHAVWFGFNNGAHVVSAPTLVPRPWDYSIDTIPAVGGGSFDVAESDEVSTPVLASELSPAPFSDWSIEWRMIPSLTAGQTQTILSAWNPANILEEFTISFRDPAFTPNPRLRISFGGATQGIDWYEFLDVPELVDGIEHEYRVERYEVNRLALTVDGTLHSEVIHTTDTSRYVFPNDAIAIGANRFGPDFTGPMRRFLLASEGVPIAAWNMDDQTAGVAIADATGNGRGATLETDRVDIDTFWSLNV